LYADNSSARWDAAQTLLSGWAADLILIDELIKFARENLSTDDSGNGTFNSLVVLGQMEREVLKSRKDEVLAFLKEAEGKGPSNAARNAEVREGLQRP
jgi:hypothetical protein